MLILTKMLAKYFIIICAVGSVREKFGIWIKAVPKIPGRARREERQSRSKLK